MSRTNKLLIAASLIYALSATAQTSEQFNRFADEIGSRNTGIKASQMNKQARVSELRTTNQLDDPEVGFTHQWGQRGIGTKWSVGITQSFEWPGVYSSRSNEIKATERAENFMEESEIMDIRTAIKQTMIEIIKEKQRLALAEEALGRIDSLSVVYNRGASLGEISRLDVNKLKIERINANKNCIDARNALSDAVDRLTALNGGEDCGSIVENLCSFPDENLLPLDVYLENARTRNPLLHYAAARAEALNYKAKTTKNSRIPGFSLGYSHDYELGEHFNGLTVGLTLPVFSTRRKMAQVNAERMAVSAERTDTEVAMTSEIESAHRQITLLDGEIAKLREVLDKDDSRRLLDIALKAGHISLITYLTEMNYFIEARMNELDLRYTRSMLITGLSRWN